MVIEVDFYVIMATLLIVGVGYLQHLKRTRYPFLNDRVEAFAKPDAYLLITEENLHGRYTVTMLQLFYIIGMLLLATVYIRLTGQV